MPMKPKPRVPKPFGPAARSVELAHKRAADLIRGADPEQGLTLLFQYRSPEMSSKDLTVRSRMVRELRKVLTQARRGNFDAAWKLLRAPAKAYVRRVVDGREVSINLWTQVVEAMREFLTDEAADIELRKLVSAAR